ncbi:TetR family transcriptional regulator [Mycolicibacterium hodleri]|uniref:TetR family transcriptional regulator n=1 Tax=Mycolicibacterium hodleri TaxID=49897 RepID=UPI001C8E3E46|nr:TetR family transcriptional regulator [Mycolicibacterium hodleri]
MTLPNHSWEDKARRSDDLLAAAESVALELGGVRFVTVAAVTDKAGIHRTGVRRYYASKEDLLLELAERGWGQWRDAVKKAAEDRLDLGPVDAATILVETITSLPVFCDLLAHVAMRLEDDVGIERARRYKFVAFAAHDELIGALQRSSAMAPAHVETLVTTTVALTASLWQTANPSPTLARLYEQEPDWGHYALDFKPRLTLILQATAIGLAEVLPTT